MANQTLSISPTDVKDPVLLGRALNRIIEAIDEVKGYRGVDTSASKQELDDLLASAKQLRADLESAIKQLNDAVNNQSAKSLSDLAEDIAALETKVNALVATRVVAGALLRLQGNGTSTPALTRTFNVASVTRVAIGRYRILLTNANVQGVSVTANFIVSTQLTTVRALMARVIVFSSTQFDLIVEEVTVGTSPALVRNASDLLSTEFLDFTGLLAPQ